MTTIAFNTGAATPIWHEGENPESVLVDGVVFETPSTLSGFLAVLGTLDRLFTYVEQNSGDSNTCNDSFCLTITYDPLYHYVKGFTSDSNVATDAYNSLAVTQFEVLK